MIAIKEVNIGLGKKANGIQFGILEVQNDGSSAILPYQLFQDGVQVFTDKVPFINDEVRGFSGIDFANDGLTNYALQKLGLEKV